MDAAMEREVLVPAEHPAFEGHFPGSPLLPGALLLDEVARHLPRAGEGAIEFARVKFRAPVRPGTRLTLRYTPAPGGARAFALTDAAGDVVADGLVREPG